MNKKDFFKNLALAGLAFVPGGRDAEQAIEAAFKHDDDPTNDLDENADHIADAIIKAFAVANDFTDFNANAPVMQGIKANIVNSLKMIPHAVVKTPAN
jgi:hypothetical protein